MTTPVALSIDRLVLQGFGERDGARVVQAFRAELARLFEQSGAPQHGAQLGQLEAGVIQLQPGRDPEWHGAQAARQMHAALLQPRSGAPHGGER